MTHDLLGGLLGQTRIVYQWMRLEQLVLWWHWLLLVVICIAVVSLVVALYRRDSVEHPRPVGWALTLLRLAALVGLFLYFLQLEKRTEQRVVRDSRVAVLVDSSLSMTLPASAEPTSPDSARTRMDQVVELVDSSPLLQQLSQQHRVNVYRFDAAPQPVLVASLAKRDRASAEETAEQGSAQTQRGAASVVLSRAQVWSRLGLLAGVIALGCLVFSLGAQVAGFRQSVWGSRLLLAGVCLALVMLGLIGWATVPHSQFTAAALLGWPTDTITMPPVEPDSEKTDEQADSQQPLGVPDDWAETLSPGGAATRIGDALKAVLEQEIGNPLAAIVLLTDGQSNAGVAPQATLIAAQNARVPIYAVGFGSPFSPPNVELVELDIPQRLYPEDRFEASAILAAKGFAGQTVTVQILAGPEGAPLEQLGIEDETTVTLDADDGVSTVSWTLEPKSVGVWQYAARVLPPAGDFDAKDNVQTADVEVVERRNRVLIIAGGPTREYRFVRNLLYRDRDVESHVFLQTAEPASSQEAQQLVFSFPADRQALSQYDAILAFDADWTQVPEESIVALEQWVAEQAGGFLMVAGSVEMPKWLARSASGTRSRLLRSLAPVVLERRGSALLASGRIEADTPWPLQLTVDGKQSDILWLTDDAETSFEVWDQFEGVYGYYAAYELKPGAKALLLFSDPRSAIDGQLPIYLATQFYGAGRTAYLGGGEMWRIRSLGDQYFDRFYTKLVRWLSQGRLLLDSDRGVLLADREQAVLGEQVALRAVLKNERYEPLIQNEVVARLIDPTGINTPLVLRPLPDDAQPGVYTGQFTVLRPGEYTVQLMLGGLTSEEILRVTVRGRVPTRELQHAERNDALLSRLAAESGGTYWPTVSEATTQTSEGTLALVAAIEPRDQVAFLPGTPDRVFQLRWRTWLLALIAGALSLEWLTRRLHRLA